MNKIFSLKRFGRYFTFDLKNAVNNFGLWLLIMCCLPVMLLIIKSLFLSCLAEEWRCLL